MGRIAEDPEFEALFDLIDETIEEMAWLSGEFDLLQMPDDTDNDALL